MESLTKNKVINDYLQQFEKEEWNEVIEHLVEFAITTINEGKKRNENNSKISFQCQSVNNNKQKFTVKKVSNENVNNKKDKLFHVSIDNLIKDSENKKNNVMFALNYKLDKLSNKLTDIDKKNKKFNVEYYN